MLPRVLGRNLPGGGVVPRPCLLRRRQDLTASLVASNWAEWIVFLHVQGDHSDREKPLVDLDLRYFSILLGQ